MCVDYYFTALPYPPLVAKQGRNKNSHFTNLKTAVQRLNPSDSEGCKWPNQGENASSGAEWGPPSLPGSSLLLGSLPGSRQRALLEKLLWHHKKPALTSPVHGTEKQNLKDLPENEQDFQGGQWSRWFLMVRRLGAVPSPSGL